MKRAIIIAALLLSGCDDGDSKLPLPRQVCTQVTGLYSCGKGGTCQQCGNWEIGCPRPLELREQFGANGPYLTCRMKKEQPNASPLPQDAPPELQRPS